MSILTNIKQASANLRSVFQPSDLGSDAASLDVEPRIKNLTSDTLRLLQTLPFWISNQEEHLQKAVDTDEQCCFNHLIGLPTKNGEEKALFDYEYDLLFQTFENNKLIWILKARGLGITEFSLRYMAWKAIAGNKNQYYNSQMAIIVGPKLDIAKDLIARIRTLFFSRLHIYFDTNSEEVILPANNVLIRAYPSNHIDAFRGQPNVSLILVDEGDFFLKGQQKQVRDAIEPYNTKSNAQIAFVSTPNMPDGLMQSVEKEFNDYKKLRLDYTVGLHKIYTLEEIEVAKRRGYFEREYNLKYEGLVGNAFHQQDIEAAITEVYNPYDDSVTTNTYCGRAMGIDEGFGSSRFAVVITQGRENRIEVIYSEEFDRPLHQDMIELIVKLKNRHHITRIFVDASNSGFVKNLKVRIGDQDSNHYVEQGRIANDITDSLIAYDAMKVTPVNFGTMHREMLFHVDELLNHHLVRIHPSFTKILTSLRTAQISENWSLSKEDTAYNDTLDAFRLSLLNYSLGKRV